MPSAWYIRILWEIYRLLSFQTPQIIHDPMKVQSNRMHMYENVGGKGIAFVGCGYVSCGGSCVLPRRVYEDECCEKWGILPVGISGVCDYELCMWCWLCI